MANKYHISPGSGRANICRATKKGCPLGADTPHFESKEEANAYIEKSAKEEHSTIPTTMKKGRGRPRKNAAEENTVVNNETVDAELVEDDFDDNEDEYIDRTAAEAERYALKNASKGNEYSERESRIMKKFVSTDKAFDKGVFVDSLNYSLEAESEESDYDAYDGDDVYDSYSDYDDYTSGDGDGEVNYTGMVIVDKDAMINQYYNELKNNFGENDMTPNDESQAKGIIKKVLKKYNLFEDYNYAPVIEYGEVEGYTVLGDVDGAMNDFRKIFNS